jgi:hypothetical protein
MVVQRRLPRFFKKIVRSRATYLTTETSAKVRKHEKGVVDSNGLAATNIEQEIVDARFLSKGYRTVLKMAQYLLKRLLVLFPQ